MRKLNFPFEERLANNNRDRKEQKDKAATTNAKSVLESFEFIVELAEDSNLNEEFFENAARHIRYASRKLKLTTNQTVLLALFVDRSEDNSIRMSEIARYAGCRTTKILRLSKEVDTLEEKGYVIASRSHKTLSYRVPQAVIEAIKENRPYEKKDKEVTDLQSFFDAFSELMEMKDDDELSHDRLKATALDYLERIKDTVYAKTLKRYGVDEDETILFTFMAHLFVENDDDSITFHDIEDLYDDDRIPHWCRVGLKSRSNSLHNNNLIENANDNGMARTDVFKLTQFAKTELLGELHLTNRGKTGRDLVKHYTFAEKTLIYSPKESQMIDELTSILSEERFKDVQARLEKAGMRKGFCCLFYGAPGTGKTETVYQLARRTGRDIMRVDVDKVKSCWVGESEKNIKSLFDRYRNICRDAEIAPILLFNEADAVLGVRMEGAAKAVDKMENSLQNIILQEMESIEGIMIATTNLTTNLDKAFERRFLYKIRYEKPTLEARARIWQAMMPDLNADDAALLAHEFDLTGGEIENIVRKHTVAAILSGSDAVEIAALRKLCQSERIATSRPAIGF